MEPAGTLRVPTGQSRGAFERELPFCRVGLCRHFDRSPPSTSLAAPNQETGQNATEVSQVSADIGPPYWLSRANENPALFLVSKSTGLLVLISREVVQKRQTQH